MHLKLTVTDVAPEAEVCVVGGGMAGLCAALAAAREGARTVLIHDRPVLGGNASTEIRVPFSGAGHHAPYANETGIILELLTEERARSHEGAGTGMVNAQWDLVLFDAVRREPNLTLMLNTHVRQAVMDGERVAAVLGVQLGTEKIWQVPARIFLDCTGDGTVGAVAGVPFRVGQESREEYNESLAPEEPWEWTLGSSMFFRARDVGRPVAFTPPDWAACYPDEESLRHRDHRDLAGGYWWIEIGYPHDTLRDNEEIRDELLRHVMGVWDHIKNRCADRERAANWALEWIGTVPAKRESRRFLGAHVLTQTQIQERVVFADRVAYGGWFIDDHARDGILDHSERPSPTTNPPSYAPFLVPPYNVPLRSLWTPQVPNLMFAGRLMSATRLAFNSLRVMRTLAVIGQAAGTAAAHAVRVGRTPPLLDQADLTQIQQSLLRQDCFIPFTVNDDGADAARGAQVTASSAAVLDVSPADNGPLLTRPLAQIVPASAPPEGLRLFVRNASAAPVELQLWLHRAQDIWDLRGLEAEPVARLTVTCPAGHCGALEVALAEPLAAPALYWLRAEPAEGVTWLHAQERLPGLSAAQHDGTGWVFAPAWGCKPLAADTFPASRPYEPANVVNGVARPERWTNVWLSEPGLPQTLRVQLAEPAPLDRVQLAWGIDLCRTHPGMPALFRWPEVARDYVITAELADGTRVLWAEVAGNYQRLRVHAAPQGLAAPVAALEVTVTATNGAPRVELDEVRAYRR